MSPAKRVRFSLLATAVASVGTTPAFAAFISTDSGGPITFDPAVASAGVGIDVNGDGTNDFIISTDGSNVNVSGNGANKVNSFVGYANSYYSTSSFVAAGSIKNSNPAVLGTTSGSSFSISTPYAELLFSVAGGTELGYLYVTGGAPASALPAGQTAAAPADTILTLSDFGYDPASFTPVPEPASLALLATGAAGLAAFRRRRASAAR